MGKMMMKSAVVGITASVLLGAGSAVAQSDCSAEIVRGTVSVERSGETVRLGTGDRIYSGDLVMTGPDGYTVIASQMYSLFLHWGFYTDLEVDDWFCEEPPRVETQAPDPAVETRFFAESVSEQSGSVNVVRGTETTPVAQGDALRNGDKILTGAGGTADITGYGCTVSVPSESIITLGPNFCTTSPVSLAPSPATTASTVATSGSAPVTGGSAAGGGSGLLLAGGAILGVGAIVAVVASDDDDDDDAPASP
jgi:hypothetical protein